MYCDEDGHIPVQDVQKKCLRLCRLVSGSVIAISREKKKIVKTLYIEADEDYVALQDGKCIEPKRVYVHEGINRLGKKDGSL